MLRRSFSDANASNIKGNTILIHIELGHDVKKKRKERKQRSRSYINRRYNDRRNATSPKKSMNACATHNTIDDGKRKKKRKERDARDGERGAGMQLSAVRDWDVDDDEVRFIVPLGVLHLTLLAGKLTVYVTPTSD